jgi:hypothetical protein
MLPAYTLRIDIISKGISINEIEFRESVSPCLTYLDALKGAFDKRPASYQFFQDQNSKEWYVRCVLMISVGQERARYLVDLFDAIIRLIAFELPDYEIVGESDKLIFS